MIPSIVNEALSIPPVAKVKVCVSPASASVAESSPITVPKTASSATELLLSVISVGALFTSISKALVIDAPALSVTFKLIFKYPVRVLISAFKLSASPTTVNLSLSASEMPFEGYNLKVCVSSISLSVTSKLATKEPIAVLDSTTYLLS